ncbi:hypothetical protein OG417_39700 [Actinoallomurus sp. NBC_01490]|jgi:hypothetical protein|nr:hypothetical protein [Actinoallomurus sp. NBC_01490]
MVVGIDADLGGEIDVSERQPNDRCCGSEVRRLNDSSRRLDERNDLHLIAQRRCDAGQVSRRFRLGHHDRLDPASKGGEIEKMVLGANGADAYCCLSTGAQPRDDVCSRLLALRRRHTVFEIDDDHVSARRLCLVETLWPVTRNEEEGAGSAEIHQTLLPWDTIDVSHPGPEDSR